MRTEPPALLIAALLHGALLGVRLVLPEPSRLASAQEHELRTIDIESLQVPPTPPLQENTAPTEPQDRPPATEATPPSNLEPRVARARGSREPSTLEPVAPTADPTVAPSAPPGPSPDRYDPLPDDGRGTVHIPGVEGPAIWALPGAIPTGPPPAPAPTETPRARPVEKDIAGRLIREAMRTNDKQIGLDLPAAGTVASAVKQVIQGSDIPNVSRGTFEVRLSGDGKVLGVRVSSSSGGTPDAWERAAQAVAAALRTRSLKMNETFSKGGTIYIDASSAVVLPSGSTSAIQLQGAGAAFDLSDVGAHTSRVVKVSTRAVPSR